MKNQRQNLIMQIVKDENIGTQEELREALKRISESHSRQQFQGI
ncbi:MAG: hypothetical protein ACLTCP_00960 [Ruminococcus bicirculans (ex Wegman et al. 2014)]